MAKKMNAPQEAVNAQENPGLEREEVEQALPKADPWEQMRKVNIPRGDNKEDRYVVFSVNERYFSIPKGKDIEVPEPIAERVDYYLEALEKERELFEQMHEQEELMQ